MVTQRRAREGARLRPRARIAGRRRSRPAGSRAADRDADARGRRDGHAALHVARAGGGPRGRPPHRHLLARRHPLRDGERAAAVPGQLVGRARLGDPARHAAAARRAAGRPAGRPGARHPALPREEPARPHPDGARRRATRCAACRPSRRRSGPRVAPARARPRGGRLGRRPRRRGLLGRGAAVQVHAAPTPTSRPWPRGCPRRS